jgi:hypothetical protein
MLDGSRSELVKSLKKLNVSLEGRLNPALLKDAEGRLVFTDSISIERAMLMIRLLQNRIIGDGLPKFLEIYVPKFLRAAVVSRSKRLRRPSSALATKRICRRFSTLLATWARA